MHISSIVGVNFLSNYTNFFCYAKVVYTIPTIPLYNTFVYVYTSVTYDQVVPFFDARGKNETNVNEC